MTPLVLAVRVVLSVVVVVVAYLFSPYLAGFFTFALMQGLIDDAEGR